MKQIFTLCSAIVLSLTSVFGQASSENFETTPDIAALETKCWQFDGVNFQTAVNGATIGNSNNLVATIGTASFTTPYVNLVTGSAISFNYKLNSRLSGASAARTITVSLLGYDGVSTPIGTPIILDWRTSATTVFSFSAPSPITDTRKIVVTITAGNNSSDFILIDNVNFGGELNYNSPYNCALSNASPLPIHLKSFQGLLAQDKAQLNWTVADNEGGNFFEIQKSTDGKEFKTIAIVGTTATVGEENYNYKDDLVSSAYYRLKLINKGSLVIYSDVLFIKKQGTVSNTLSLQQNPVKNTLKFSFTSDINSQTEVAVYNMLGVKVYQTSFAASKGANTISKTLDGQIKGGTYVLEVKNATNRSIAKFLKD
jgi:hypothetical protein